MIQIRDVPDDLHAELKVLAARAGMSLSGFLTIELEKLTRRVSLQEIFDEFADVRVPITSDEIVAAVAEGRRGR